MGGFLAQNTHSQRVKSANGQPARILFAEHLAHAFLHFFGGFVGKGNRGDVVRRIACFGNQIADFLGNHAGFAAAGTGQDQQRPCQILNGLLLLGVEFHGEQY